LKKTHRAVREMQTCIHAGGLLPFPTHKNSRVFVFFFVTFSAVFAATAMCGPVSLLTFFVVKV